MQLQRSIASKNAALATSKMRSALSAAFFARFVIEASATLDRPNHSALSCSGPCGSEPRERPHQGCSENQHHKRNAECDGCHKSHFRPRIHPRVRTKVRPQSSEFFCLSRAGGEFNNDTRSLDFDSLPSGLLGRYAILV